MNGNFPILGFGGDLPFAQKQRYKEKTRMAYSDEA